MAALNCPACAEPASLVPLGSGDGVRAEACRRCGGIWVTGDAAPEKAFRSLTEDNREVAGRQQVRGNCATCGQRLAESDYCPPCQSSRPLLACPGCGQPMMRFPARADIAIDRCSTCQGTWFDGSELASLAACVTSPDPAPTPAKGEFRLIDFGDDELYPRSFWAQMLRWELGLGLLGAIASGVRLRRD